MCAEQAGEDGNQFFDEDISWADATVRRDYEAALGRCILHFNQLDNLLGDILKTVLLRLGRSDMVEECVYRADFSLRVRALDLLRHSTEGQGIARVPVNDLRSVAGERNLLSHAHFAENPFSSEYRLVNRKGRTEQDYTAERIDGVGRRILEAWRALRYAESYYAFADVSLPREPEA